MSYIDQMIVGKSLMSTISVKNNTISKTNNSYITEDTLMSPDHKSYVEISIEGV